MLIRVMLHYLNRKIKLYEKKFNRKVGRKMVISPFIDPRGTLKFAKELDIEIVEDVEDFRAE